MNETKVKFWWQSKTVWLSILTAIVALLNALTEQVTDPTVVGIAAVGVAVCNIILRFVTKDEIAL